MNWIDGFLSEGLEFYLHRLPMFRGKWKLLRPVRPLLNGIPVKTRYSGVSLLLDVGDRTNELCVLGRYEPTVPAEVEKLRQGDCFIDIGANCGLFSLMAGRKVGKNGLVVAFEPCLETYALFIQNIVLNQLTNIIPFNLALSDVPGRTYLDTSTAGHSGRYSIAPDRMTGKAITAVQIRRDGKIVEMVGDRPTVIKIDVEGYELSVLRGITPMLGRPQTYKVVVEIDDANLSHYGSTVEELYQLMADHGFKPRYGSGHQKHFDEVFLRCEIATAKAENMIARA